MSISMANKSRHQSLLEARYIAIAKALKKLDLSTREIETMLKSIGFSRSRTWVSKVVKDKGVYN